MEAGEIVFISSIIFEFFCSKISRDEMKKFVAIIVHMGMIKKRSISEYWSTDSYLITPIFHSQHYLSRDRFLFILR